LVKPGIDGPNSENFGCRCRFHSGPLCACGIEAGKAANECEAGRQSELHVIPLPYGGQAIG
jgi:hypothetical protein